MVLKNLKYTKKGLAHFYWHETEQGCLITNNLESPSYAILDKDGSIVSTATPLNEIPPDQSCTSQAALQQRLEQLTSETINVNDPANIGFRPNFKQNLVVFQVSFSNESMTYDFSDDIFGNKFGSAKHYFSAVSNNNYTLQPVKENFGTTNDGFIDIQLSMEHPGCGGSCSQNTIRTLYQQIIKKASNYMDFSTYDKNGDSHLTPSELSIMFIWAGYEAATPLQTQEQRDKSVWAHKWEVSPISINNVTVSKYAVFGEKQMQSGGIGKATVGVMVHELGHLMLDLPDLYPKNTTTQKTIGVWGVMGSGSWNNGGKTPANMTAWSRIRSGFIKPNSPTQTSRITTEFLKEPVQLFIDPYLKELGEYFLIENRTKQDYDHFIPGEGTLITHFRPTFPAFSDEPRALIVVNADNEGTQGGDQGDGGDVFPGTTNRTVVSKNTKPSINPSSGLNTELSILNISNNSTSSVANVTLPPSKLGIFPMYLSLNLSNGAIPKSTLSMAPNRIPRLA